MWFWYGRIDIEGLDIANDKVEGCLGFLWDVDAQVQRRL